MIKMQLELRNYQAGDGTAVYHLVERVLREYELEMDPEGTDKDISDIPRFYIIRGGTFRVLTAGHKVVGCYGLYRINDFCCELRKMYLLRQYRGIGMGRKLMDNALDTARELGFREMVLETSTRLKEARVLYDRYGFVPYDPPRMSARCDLALRKILLNPPEDP